MSSLRQPTDIKIEIMTTLYNYSNGMDTWKAKRRLGYDRSTTKKLITFVEQLF